MPEQAGEEGGQGLGAGVQGGKKDGKKGSALGEMGAMAQASPGTSGGAVAAVAAAASSPPRRRNKGSVRFAGDSAEAGSPSGSAEVLVGAAPPVDPERLSTGSDDSSGSQVAALVDSANGADAAQLQAQLVNLKREKDAIDTKAKRLEQELVEKTATLREKSRENSDFEQRNAALVAEVEEMRTANFMGALLSEWQLQTRRSMFQKRTDRLLHSREAVTEYLSRLAQGGETAELGRAAFTAWGSGARATQKWANVVLGADAAQERKVQKSVVELQRGKGSRLDRSLQAQAGELGRREEAATAQASVLSQREQAAAEQLSALGERDQEVGRKEAAATAQAADLEQREESLRANTERGAAELEELRQRLEGEENRLQAEGSRLDEERIRWENFQRQPHAWGSAEDGSAEADGAPPLRRVASWNGGSATFRAAPGEEERLRAQVAGLQGQLAEKDRALEAFQGNSARMKKRSVRVAEQERSDQDDGSDAEVGEAQGFPPQLRSARLDPSEKSYSSAARWTTAAIVATILVAAIPVCVAGFAAGALVSSSLLFALGAACSLWTYRSIKEPEQRRTEGVKLEYRTGVACTLGGMAYLGLPVLGLAAVTAGSVVPPIALLLVGVVLLVHALRWGKQGASEAGSDALLSGRARSSMWSGGGGTRQLATNAAARKEPAGDGPLTGAAFGSSSS